METKNTKREKTLPNKVKHLFRWFNMSAKKVRLPGSQVLKKWLPKHTFKTKIEMVPLSCE